VRGLFGEEAAFLGEEKNVWPNAPLNLSGKTGVQHTPKARLLFGRTDIFASIQLDRAWSRAYKHGSKE
jgi:hypothetical protein